MTLNYIEGLFAIFAGVYALLLARGVLPLKTNKPQEWAMWRRKFGTPLMVASPALILLGLALVLKWGGGGESSRSGGGSPPPTQAGTPANDFVWQEFASKEWNFKVQFPGTPEDMYAPDPTAPPKKGNAIWYTCALPDRQRVFMVRAFDSEFPDVMTEAEVDREFEDAQKQLAQNYSGTIHEPKRITVQGKYPGSDFVLRGKVGPHDMRMCVRLILVKPRLYTLGVMLPPGDDRPPDVTTFFDSFQITN